MFIKVLEACFEDIRKYTLIPVNNIDFIRENPSDEKRCIIYLKSKEKINCIDRIHSLELTLNVMHEKTLKK